MLRALGIPVTPGKLKAFERIPLPILAAVLRAWARTKHFDTIAATVSTPALDRLHAGLAN